MAHTRRDPEQPSKRLQRRAGVELLQYSSLRREIRCKRELGEYSQFVSRERVNPAVMSVPYIVARFDMTELDMLVRDGDVSSRKSLTELRKDKHRIANVLQHVAADTEAEPPGPDLLPKSWIMNVT